MRERLTRIYFLRAMARRLRFSEAPSLGSTREIPSLDGMRAIAIGIVILSHAQGTRGFPSWVPGAVSNHGALGVQIFFVLSGFLITTLFAKEQARTGTISLGLFYARRTVRIFPPLYLFLGVVALETWMGVMNVPWKNLLFAATFAMNYISGGVWITGHLWSLSVQEQFYIVWPLMIRCIGMRGALQSAAVAAVIAPIFCLLLYLVDPSLGSHAAKLFPFVADSIAAGCVLAGILPWLRKQNVFKWFASPAGDLVIPLTFVLDLGRNHPRIHLAFVETALNLCVCFALVRYTSFPDGFVGRILNDPILVFVGKISYSLYLWQQIFMNRFGTNMVQSFPINIAAAFCCALLSYYWVGSPFAKVRRWLRPVRTTVMQSHASPGIG